MNRFAEQLRAAGMSTAESFAKGGLFERALQALPLGSAESDSARAFYVPGRVEVLGKHTDYAGGRSLLCTVERGFCVIARARGDARITVINARSKTRCTLALNPELQPAEKHWSNYPGVVVRRIARNFPSARRGADIAFISDLPAASGMSSSSALIVAIFLALAQVNAIAETNTYRREIRNLEDLAGYLGTIENGESFGTLTGDRGVGTFGGSEDHTAILCSHAGKLGLYSFCPIRHEGEVTLPAEYVLALGVSGVVAMKTGSAMAKYNRASLAARKVLDIWREASGRNDATLAAAVAHLPVGSDQIREALKSSSDKDFPARLLCDRFEQYLEESTVIIPSAAAALAAGDLAGFGLLVDRSQQGAENLLGNQVPETIALARSARALGAVAASAFGAGFGGSVWALIPAAASEKFIARWSSGYRNQFPAAEDANFFLTRPGPAALHIR
jgi:galactokinase